MMRAENLFFIKITKIRPLGPRAVQKAIKKYVAAALIKRDITPHTLRHIAATLELGGGVDEVIAIL